MVAFPELEEADVWTHCLALSHVPDALEDFLGLLTEVLILQGLPGEVHDAIALDFYKIPRPGVPPDDWPNTEIGELVSRMKYWTDDPVAHLTAQEQVADALARTIVRHPSYLASRIVSVPGHDASEVTDA